MHKYFSSIVVSDNLVQLYHDPALSYHGITPLSRAKMFFIPFSLLNAGL